MKNVISGFAFHCHHGTLFEWVTDYDERVGYIKENKPREEVELRLKLFRMIPEDRIPKELLKAEEARYKAEEAYYKAREAYSKTLEAYYKAREAYDKAREAYYKAREAYDKAREAYCKAGEAYYPKIEKLHSELCPDCPWDGKTIFPEGGK